MATQDQERIQFVCTPDGRIHFTKPDGEVKSYLSPAIARDIAEVEMSAAQKRLKRAKAARADAPEVTKIEWTDETFFIRRLNWSQISRVHLMASRNGDGALDVVNDDDDLRAFTIAVLESCVVHGESDLAPYFTLQDAAAFADSTEPEIILLVGVLFGAALKVTPELTPPKLKGATVPERIAPRASESSNSAAAAASISTMPECSAPMPITGAAGSKTTPSSDTPVSSPNGSNA